MSCFSCSPRSIQGFPVPLVNFDHIWSGKQSHAQTAARPLCIMLEGSHYTVTATATMHANQTNSSSFDSAILSNY
jgi:hypothetical protein